MSLWIEHSLLCSAHPCDAVVVALCKAAATAADACAALRPPASHTTSYNNCDERLSGHPGTREHMQNAIE